MNFKFLKKSMILTATVSDNETFVSKILKNIQETVLKYSQVSDSEQLICTDSKFVLQRKLARLSRNGDPGKLVYLHGFDVVTLFQEIIRDTILYNYMKDNYTVDVYILADMCQDLSDSIIDIISDKNIHIYVCSSFSSLQSKINSGKFEKKVVLNFDRTAKYLPCDLFIYFGLNLNPSEIREMFKLSMLDKLGNYIIIDTIPQRINKQTKFLAKERHGIVIQNDMAYFSLKNCSVSGKLICDMINRIILDNAGNTHTVLEDDEDDYEDEDEMVDSEVHKVISDKLAVFTDRDVDNYMLNFVHRYIGKLKVFDSINNAWFSLTKCMNSIKLVCFLYIRKIPDFRDIAAYCNAWKNMHPDGEELIVLILISPVLEKSTADNLIQYKSDFNSLLSLATTTSCCSGLHCEETLIRQYIMPNDCACLSSAPIRYDDVSQIIMSIFDAIETFVRNRSNSFNPVFHEQELVSAVATNINSDFSKDIISSYLYRGIPFMAKDGTLKVTVPLFNKPSVFVIKNDYQTYINTSTLTGVDFNTPVNDILNNVYEEYVES